MKQINPIEKDKHKNQLKYAQQHLANERTYLAWIRTVVAVIGIGLLIAHLGIKGITLIVTILGIGMVGTLTIIIATFSYLNKKKQIDQQTFYSSHTSIIYFSFLLFVIILFALLISACYHMK
ncbi:MULTISPECIES: YidH family protein [Virgibacillus]|uniref:DUF202 domain-containing protein n=2 Tax=Virgibacillus TaxID=84406 RepID=A0ABQ2DLC7_9BACI|nr:MULTISPECIES: DUF202 domain-containing protein [Virgibacillus]EQB37731.1 hypothetical protein M948_04010 [Virgibacillus sp. CM-4]MYL40467.1 DUF202 domain-containing protein [Virgibacillus massiliensis]GGJ58787.1 hypothetical protein GCM10007111_20950 [Virgibacillus kapii]CDQ38744.1 putative membrane protein [Virgibacillus massiliensis]